MDQKYNVFPSYNSNQFIDMKGDAWRTFLQENPFYHLLHETDLPETESPYGAAEYFATSVVVFKRKNLRTIKFSAKDYSSSIEAIYDNGGKWRLSTQGANANTFLSKANPEETAFASRLLAIDSEGQSDLLEGFISHIRSTYFKDYEEL